MTAPDLRRLRQVEAGDVLKSGVLAARLTRDRGDVVFAYLPSYLRDGGPALARSLPMSVGAVRLPGGAVPPYFAGLLPEGARLQAVATGTRTSLDDHLTLLLAVGGDAIGDVAVVPAGEDDATPAPAVRLVAGDVPDLGAVFARATSTRPEELDRVGLPGVQAKASASMVSTPVATATGPAILKLNPARDYPRLVDNEHFFLGMAQACGMPAPAHQLVIDAQGRRGLVVARFDRVTSVGSVQPLAQEDGCQVLGEYPAAKYRLKTETVVRGLVDAVADGDGSRPLAVRRCLQLVAFSYLIGNGDLHAKNLSVRQAPGGHWEVTPVYDVLSTQPYAGWRDPVMTTSLAMTLYGRANRLDRAHLLEAGRRLGVPPRALVPALDAVCDAAGPWAERVGEIGLGERPSELLAELLLRRRDELA